VVLQGLLDNVRSLFNVGSIFRSADGAGFDMLYLCGVTPTPANPKLSKTALGAEQAVAWQAAPNAVELAERLLAEGRRLWALEEGPGAESLLSAPPPPTGTVLVVGGEVTGVDPDLLRLCERTFQIPMYGSKRSLNVATAFGIAAVVLVNRAEER
jgi:tRNA G18 (ribose-2'-O)-methylase SpoU